MIIVGGEPGRMRRSVGATTARRDGATIVATQLVGIGSGLGLSVVAANTLSTVEFAVIGWAMSWITHLSIVAGFGTGLSSVVLASRSPVTDLRRLTASVLSLVAIASLLTSAVWMLGAGSVTASTDAPDRYADGARALLIWIPAAALSEAATSLLRGAGHYVLSGLTSEYLRRLPLLVLLLVSATLDLGIGLGTVLMLAAVVELGVAGLALHELLRFRGEPTKGGATLTSLTRFSARFVVPALTGRAVPNAGIWIAVLVSDSLQAAFLVIALRLGTLGYLPQYLGVRLFGPRIAALDPADLSAVERPMRRYAAASTLVSGAALGAFLMAGPNLLEWMFGAAFRPAFWATAAVLATGLVSSAAGFGGLVLSHVGHEKVNSHVALLTLVLFAAGAVVLGGRWGATGIAVASLSATMFQKLAVVILAWTRLRVVTVPGR